MRKEIIYVLCMIVAVSFVIATDCGGADTNGDGVVDATDYINLKKNMGHSCSSPGWCDGADMNKDGKVDFVDLNILTTNMGKSDCETEVEETCTVNNYYTSKGGGVSSNYVLKLFMGNTYWTDDYDNYHQIALENFALKSYVARLEARVSLLEKAVFGKTPTEDQIDMQIAMNKAKETGEEQRSGDWYCNEQRCYKLGNMR